MFEDFDEISVFWDLFTSGSVEALGVFLGLIGGFIGFIWAWRGRLEREIRAMMRVLMNVFMMMSCKWLDYKDTKK